MDASKFRKNIKQLFTLHLQQEIQILQTKTPIPLGKQSGGGRPRNLDARGGLGLVLMWYRT